MLYFNTNVGATLSWAVLMVLCTGLGGIVGGLVVLAFCR